MAVQSISAAAALVPPESKVRDYAQPVSHPDTVSLSDKAVLYLGEETGVEVVQLIQRGTTRTVSTPASVLS